MGTAKSRKKSKFAGYVAPPLVAKREAMDLRIKVDPKDLARVDDLATSLLGACDSVGAAADRVVSAMTSSHKRQHRRVLIIVEDEEGSQLAKSLFDLKEANELTVRVNGDDIRTSSSRIATE